VALEKRSIAMLTTLPSCSVEKGGTSVHPPDKSILQGALAENFLIELSPIPGEKNDYLYKN
jgi:hypothetical protein